VFKGRHFDRSVILLILAYGLSLRDLKEMMAERGTSIDHSTIHRRVVHFSALLLRRLNGRKRADGGKWHIGETYVTGFKPAQRQGSRCIKMVSSASSGLGPAADWQFLASAKRIADFQTNWAKVSDRPIADAIVIALGRPRWARHRPATWSRKRTIAFADEELE
jgi:hypothetical protein